MEAQRTIACEHQPRQAFDKRLARVGFNYCILIFDTNSIWLWSRPSTLCPLVLSGALALSPFGDIGPDVTLWSRRFPQTRTVIRAWPAFSSSGSAPEAPARSMLSSPKETAQAMLSADLPHPRHWPRLTACSLLFHLLRPCLYHGFAGC